MKRITVSDMTTALRELRERTGDSSLGHTVKQGQFQLVSVARDTKGKGTVTPLSPWQAAADHLRTLQHFTR